MVAIRLMHSEHGLPDPTVDQALLLVCRGECCHQKIAERKRLPIKIRLLDVLKSFNSYMHPSNYTYYANIVGCYGRHLLYPFMDSFVPVNVCS